jgi:hypothetical protein
VDQLPACVAGAAGGEVIDDDAFHIGVVVGWWCRY